MNPVRWLMWLRARMPALRQAVPRRARWAVITLAVGLCLATFGPALAGAAGAELSSVEAFVHAASSPFCHQLPSRSFIVSGHALPLCTRCTGMWIGITLGVALGVAALWRHRWSVGMSAFIVGLALSEADHLREQSGQPGWPWVRFSLGLLLFAGLTIAVSFDVLALLWAGWRALRRS